MVLLNICLDFQDLLVKNGGFGGGGGAKWGRSHAILTLNKLVFTFGVSYVCASFGENRSTNATVTDGRPIDGFCNVSHAICYNYGADRK